MRTSLTCLFGLLMTFAASGVRADIILYPGNDGFETPDVGGGYLYPFQFNPQQTIDAVWTFVGGAGFAANGSGFGVSGATNGNVNGGATSAVGQAAFIQGGDGTLAGASISQQFTLGGDVSVNFSLEARPPGGGYGGDNQVIVMIDGISLGTYAATLGSPTNAFTDFTTPNLSLVDGLHTLSFVGFNPLGGDNTQFLDNVFLVSVPEPSTYALLGLAATVFGWRYRRNRQKQPAIA